MRVTLNAYFYEGREQSCGGNELEANHQDLVLDVPAGSSTIPSSSRLEHDEWCYYRLWAQRCDDKAFFSDMRIVNEVKRL
ncbi:MAG: hypothetical protein RL385_3755 [Pseudomonadota bacterium]